MGESGAGEPPERCGGFILRMLPSEIKAARAYKQMRMLMFRKISRLL
jgi:hypothetical protein